MVECTCRKCDKKFEVSAWALMMGLYGCPHCETWQPSVTFHAETLNHEGQIGKIYDLT